jgi:uncharacterized protein (DUF885 family)
MDVVTRAGLDHLLAEYLSDDPEMLAALGLDRRAAGRSAAGCLTIGTDELVLRRIARANRIRDELRTARSPEADRELAGAARVLEWYLSRVVEAREFVLHSYPVQTCGRLSDLFLSGIPHRLLSSMAWGYRLRSRQDAFDFVSRLLQIPAKLAAVEQAMARRNAAGLPTPRPILADAIRQMRRFVESRAEACSVASRFERSVGDCADVSEPEKRHLRTTVVDAVAREVQPAYRRLLERCSEMLVAAPESCSLALRARGSAYYAHLLHKLVGTSEPAERLLQIGWQEIARLREELLERMSRWGVERTTDESLWQSWRRLVARRDERVHDLGRPAAWIERARAGAARMLGLPVAPVRLEWLAEDLEDSDREAHYEPASSLNEGAAVVRVNRARAPRNPVELRTLVFHEAVPGHHCQIEELRGRRPHPPSFLAALPLPGWSEGWASYAETLAVEIGLHGDDGLGALGPVAADLRRAVRLVLDVGIHWDGWSGEEATRRLRGAIGEPEWLPREIARVSAEPGDGSAYTIGRRQIESLRNGPAAHLDPGGFARAVLRCGPCPLELSQDLLEAQLGVAVRRRAGAPPAAAEGLGIA